MLAPARLGLASASDASFFFFGAAEAEGFLALLLLLEEAAAAADGLAFFFLCCPSSASESSSSSSSKLEGSSSASGWCGVGGWSGGGGGGGAKILIRVGREAQRLIHTHNDSFVSPSSSSSSRLLFLDSDLSALGSPLLLLPPSFFSFFSVNYGKGVTGGREE